MKIETYEDFDKAMNELCDKRREHWDRNEWDMDFDTECKMVKLEKEYPEWFEKWWQIRLNAIKDIVEDV